MSKLKLIVQAFLLTAILSLSLLGQTNELTYQGRLVASGAAANTPHDFEFRLCASETNCATPLEIKQEFGIPVSNGIFTVKLNFGDELFDGGDRWLEIAVKPAGGSTFTSLVPRQRVTSAPYSMKSSKADALSSSSCVLCVTNNQIFSLDGSKVTGTVSNAATATTATSVSGVVQIANGGTGSSVKNFVDLSTTQTITGTKAFGHASFVNPFAPVDIQGSLTVGHVLTAEQFHGNGDGLVNVPGTFKWQTASGLAYQAQPNTGYLATNDAQVTVTLPAGIGIGETVRISGSGAGGWRIAQNDGQSVIGNAGVSLVPPAWIPRESNRNWSGVASSADGIKLVATVSGATGFGGRIYVSDNAGDSWTPRESNRDWRAVTSSADGTKLAAVAFNEPVFTSTDSGLNWTARAVGGAASIASSADGAKLVTGTPYDQLFSIPGYIHKSSNSGISWTSLNINQVWAAFASSADGSKLVATVRNPSSGRVYTSTDSGATWTIVPNLSGPFVSIASSSDGTKLIVAGDSTRIFTSTDSGATWTHRESVRFWNAVASSSDGSRLAAAGEDSRIYISIDSGSTWVPVESVRNWSAVALSSDGTRIVATARGGGQIYTSTIPASLGKTTTLGTCGYLVGTQYTSLELQYIGDGRFLPLSYAGTILGY